MLMLMLMLIFYLNLDQARTYEFYVLSIPSSYYYADATRSNHGFPIFLQELCKLISPAVLLVYPVLCVRKSGARGCLGSSESCATNNQPLFAALEPWPSKNLRILRALHSASTINHTLPKLNLDQTRTYEFCLLSSPFCMNDNQPHFVLLGPWPSKNPEFCVSSSPFCVNMCINNQPLFVLLGPWPSKNLRILRALLSILRQHVH